MGDFGFYMMILFLVVLTAGEPDLIDSWVSKNMADCQITQEPNP